MVEGLTVILRVLINLLYTHTMPNNHYCSTYMMPYPHLMAKNCLTIGRKSKSEAWNLPTSGCKSMVEGLTIMPRVLINLLYTHTMPNNHYCSTYMMPYPHLMAKHCLTIGRKSRSEAWNLPTSGCKSMVEGLTIMPRVLINLLYTHTMPNNHYCSTYMMPYPHLMAKNCLTIGRKSRSEAYWNLPTSGCKSMMEGLIIMLGVLINLLYTHTMPNNHYCSTYMMPYPHLMAKHCLTIGRKSRSEAWNLPTSGCKSMVEGLTIMLGVLINLLYTHTMPNNHYCSTYMMPYPHLMAKHCLTIGRKSRSEAWNLPTSGCKSMMEGLTVILRVLINLLYTHTMPNNHYCSTYMAPPLDGQTLPDHRQKIQIWGMKPANKWL